MHKAIFLFPIACSAGSFCGFHLSSVKPPFWIRWRLGELGRELAKRFTTPQLSTVFLIQDGGLNNRWEYPLVPPKSACTAGYVPPPHPHNLRTRPNQTNPYPWAQRPWLVPGVACGWWWQVELNPALASSSTREPLKGFSRAWQRVWEI